MARVELRIFGTGKDHSANWATTTIAENLFLPHLILNWNTNVTDLYYLCLDVRWKYIYEIHWLI